MKVRMAALGLLLAASAAALPNTGEAATSGGSWVPVAHFEMNERGTATVLRDSSGNGAHGRIGPRVTPTFRRYHFFTKASRTAFFRRKRIDWIRDPTGELNPGSYEDGWSVTVRFTWLKGNDMNLVQKGQGDPDGGIFKVKTSVPAAGQPEGYLKCLFRGANGVNSQTESYSAPRSNDGKWHTLRCDILPTGGTRMLLDGVVVNTNPKSPGIIWNDWPVTIGGDIKCGDTFCNYWHGAIGFVRFKGWDEN